MLRKNPDPLITNYIEPFTRIQTEKYFELFIISDDTIVNVEIEKKYSRNTSNMLSISGVAEIKMCKMCRTKIAEISVEMISSVVSSQVIISILESALCKYDELLSEE